MIVIVFNLLILAFVILFPIGYIIHDIFWAVYSNGWGYILLSIWESLASLRELLMMVSVALLWLYGCSGGFYPAGGLN